MFLVTSPGRTKKSLPVLRETTSLPKFGLRLDRAKRKELQCHFELDLGDGKENAMLSGKTKHTYFTDRTVEVEGHLHVPQRPVITPRRAVRSNTYSSCGPGRGDP